MVVWIYIVQGEFCFKTILLMKKRLKKILILAVFPIVLFLTLGIVSFGAILGNVVAAPLNGGAIIVGSGSTLNIKNGFVSGLSAANGGGVYVNAGGTFNLSGGSIYNNSAILKGNNIYNAGTFTMTGGRVGKQAFDRYDENGNPSSSGQYVYFGSYPKTIKANNVTINTSNVDSNGYFLGSDNQRYAKFTATPIEDNYKFTNGETIVSDRDYYFKVEPILWRILSEEDGKAIILAKDIIEASIFYGDYNNRTINERTIYPSNYQYSYIRTFINGDFYNKAFSLSEKNKIITTAVNNRTSAANGVESEYFSADTEDNVWLLSYTDLSNADYGFDQSLENVSNTRIKRTTDYSLAGGVLADVDDQTGYIGLWWSRSPSGNEMVLVLFDDGMGDNREVGNILGVVPALTVSLKGDGDVDNCGIYNTGTMNLYGGNVYDNVYSSANINTKMACNVAGTITLGNSATITLRDYAGTTPNYAINLSNTRTAGTILTLVGSSTQPDLTKLNISGYNSEECRLSVAKNSSGNWTVSLVNIAIDFPMNWKTQVASASYMTTTITSANITKIQFVATVPSGYTKIGTLSTGLPVYQGTTATEIAFVWEKIYAPKDSGYLFNELKKVTSFKFDTFNTSKATNMYAAFRFGESLQSLDLSNFNTSKVTNMGNMFYSCKSLTSLNVSNFNTSNVTYMNSMFGNCLSLTSLNISSFNTTNVKNMSAMFQSCNALTNIDVSNFNTSKVTNMDHMFYNCLSLTSLNLSNFNTSNVTDMSYMFQAFLVDSALTSLDVSNFDTSKVTNMGSMFSGLNALTSLNLSNFNTSKVTNMGSMFQGCNALTNIDVSNFNTSNVTDMSAMFQSCNALTNIGVSNFNTTNVTNMYAMFQSCNALTSLDISNFDTSKVTDMEGMFGYCEALTSLDVSSFDTSKVIDMEGMFEYCNVLTSLDVSNFDTSNVTNMRFMFSSCDKITSLNLSNFNTSNVTNMYAMFQNCYVLTNIDVSNFNTSNVTDMRCMFSGLNSLTSLDVSNFDTSNVTNMYAMFQSCKALTSLDVSNFDTTNVTDMFAMFQSCNALTSLDVSNFNTSNVTNMKYMFLQCSGLTSLNLSSFDMTNVATYDNMLNFGSTGKLKALKTPYNNTSALSITTGSTLYNVETGAVVTSVPAGTSRSLTYSSTRPSSFVSNNKIYKFETCFVEIETPVENEFDEAVNESKNCFVLNNKRKFQIQIVKVEG